MNKPVSEVLFEYLRDIIYAPEKAKLDSAALPEDFQALGMGLEFLATCVKEQKSFATALSKGDLQVSAPSADNVLAAPLAAMLGSLRHLTWQTQQVAKGDYGQRVDFMGDFSAAFNEMVYQLKERRQKLIDEKLVVEQKNRDLAQSHELFLTVIVNAPELIVVVDAQSGKEYMHSKSVDQMQEETPWLLHRIHEEILNCPVIANKQKVSWEMNFIVDKPDEKNAAPQTIYYHVLSSFVPWEGKQAIVHVLRDCTADKEKERVMQTLAFQDSLTNFYNRRYGNALMEEWLEKKYSFSLALIDIDHLKYCNDVYGHEEGNVYILLVCEMLKKLSGNPILCRIGGDEFLVISKDLSEQEMDHQLNTARRELAAYSAENGVNFPRSFSYGICGVTADNTLTIDELIAESDLKMYRYKFLHKQKLRDESGAEIRDERML